MLRLREISNGIGRVLGSVAMWACGAFVWIVIGFFWFLAIQFHLMRDRYRDIWDRVIVDDGAEY